MSLVVTVAAPLSLDPVAAIRGRAEATPDGLRDLVAVAPGLRWVQGTAAGAGEQLLAAGLDASRAPTVTSAAGLHAQPLAEFALFGMLAFLKDLDVLQQASAARTWSPILVSTLPGTPATRGLLDAAAPALLPAHAVVVNVGRGSVLQTAALVAALDAGRLRGAVLDVADVEPLPGDSPLWDRPDVVLSPHTAALTVDEDDRILDLFCDNLTRYIRGEPLRNVVDPAQGY